MELFDGPGAHPLREYQKKAVDNVIRVTKEGKNPLLIMATGTGKTIVFAEVIKRMADEGNNNRSLVIAHRDELIRQAQSKIYQQSGIQPAIEKAAEKARRDSKVVIGSVQTMQNHRLQKWPADYFHLLTVDEAHHACANSYRKIIDHFSSSVLGVTATPDRADEKQLGEIFDAIAFEYPMHKAIKDGYLCKIVGKKVKDFDIDLNDLKIVAGDFTDSGLGNKISEYITPIANSIKKETEGRKTLVFMPNVASSELMAKALRELGLKADHISGKLKTQQRRTALNKFSSGATTHLASCDILLEGYDEPSIDAIVMLRPTGSRTVYAQSIGRGTRIHPRKENLLLLEYTFNSKNLQLVSPYELFATAGFDERVRRQAEQSAGEYVDFFDQLSQTKENFYSLGSVINRSLKKVHEFSMFDPLGMGDLIGVDLSGEFDIKYKGRTLEGPATRKQIELLSRYNIVNAYTLDKAQASVLIGKIMEKGWAPYRGPATERQTSFLGRYGIYTNGMTKAQASVLIDTIKKRESAGERINPFEMMEAHLDG